MSWKDLDIKLKAELIKLGVLSGIRDIKLIRLLYDDINTPTLVVDLSYNETNVKPLLGIERIKLEYGIPEEELNKANDIIQLIENEISLEEINNQLPVLFRQFKNGGYKDGNDKTKNKENKTYGPYELPAVIITPDNQYTEFINSLPDNHKYTPEEEYRMYKYWQLWGKPKNFLYTLDNPNEDGDYMFNWDTSDSSYHGSSIAWGDDGVGYFIKPKHHETLKYELDYFNKGLITEEGGIQRPMTPEEQKEWEEFKSKYTLKDDGNFYKYVPKAKEDYISNNPTLALVGKVKKYDEGGYENPDEPPISESTYVELPPLNIYELELLNYLLSNPTAEQEYFRNLAVLNMTVPQSNQGVVLNKEEQTLVGKALLGYNNFRYSHPWAEGLSYTPIIGDGMDLISLAGDINNKNYINAGLSLGMIAIPNFIGKPIKNYKKLKRHKNNYYTAFKDPNHYIEFKYWNNLADKVALKKYPVLNALDRLKAELFSRYYKDRVYELTKDILYKTLSLYKNLSENDYTRLANIINLSPEYGIFLQQNPDLNPLSLETLDKFLERLSLSIRGISALTDNDALVYLSTPPLYATGGDRLSTKGLYTSNSYDIADAFSRPLDNNLTFNSYIGELQFPFIIDKNLTFELQLKLYRSYIDHYWDLGLTGGQIPGTIAREATYVRGNGDNYKNVIERSYYPKELGENIVNLVNIHNRGYLPNLRGRWGNSNMLASNEYFIPKYPNNSLSEYITFMKAAKELGIISSPDINFDRRYKESANIRKLYKKQRDKRDELYSKALEEYRDVKKKLNKATNTIGGITFTALPVMGLSYAYNAAKSSREAPDPTKMTYEEFIEYDNLIESVNKKTGISKDELYKYSIAKLNRILRTENNSRKNGGFIFPNLVFSHKFEDGGYTNNAITTTLDDKPKVVQKGTVGWNPFNVFNRNYRGAPIYESENFGDSFRLARIDGVPIFIWDGKAYNTNLKPNPLVEAARAWDTKGDLRKIEFQKRIISDPEGTMEYFRKEFPKNKYTTMNDMWDEGIYNIESMYGDGALGMPNNVIVKGARYDLGNLLWDYLNTTNLTYNQKLALMANSYKESMGWTTTEQTNGPARGYYQLEKELFGRYKKWLQKNKLEDNIINETKYILDLFENHRDELITPISANLDIEDVINNYKDAEEDYANNHRSAYVHRGYYTEDALRDWDEGDLDAAVKAMEALFEKAGKPRLEDRQKIAWLLSEIYK